MAINRLYAALKSVSALNLQIQSVVNYKFCHLMMRTLDEHSKIRIDAILNWRLRFDLFMLEQL